MHTLLAALLLSCAGCATQWCHLPDDCAHAFRQTQLGWELNDICNRCGAGDSACGAGMECGHAVHVYEDAVWLDEPKLAPRPRIKVGPPPVPYEPPLPPKFLPVPARSVFGSGEL